MLKNATKNEASKSETIFFVYRMFLDRKHRECGLFDYVKVKTKFVLTWKKRLRRSGSRNVSLTHFDTADFAYSRCTACRYSCPSVFNELIIPP
jgi:hypothetical protein